MIDTMRAIPATQSELRGKGPWKSHRHARSGRISHDVAIVLYDGFTPFELGVACEVFGDDRWVAPGDPWYHLFICGENSRPVVADTGFQILVPHGLDTLSGVDTVIVS